MKRAVKWTSTGVITLMGVDRQPGRKVQDGRRRPRKLQCRRCRPSKLSKYKISFLQNSKLHLFCLVDIDQLKSAGCYFLRSTSTAAFFSVDSRQPFSSSPEKSHFVWWVFAEMLCLLFVDEENIHTIKMMLFILSLFCLPFLSAESFYSISEYLICDTMLLFDDWCICRECSVKIS